MKVGVKMFLVTGITGHTGRYFIQELVKNHYHGLIRCVVRHNSDTSWLDSSGLQVEKVFGDLEDPSFLDACMIDVATIVHIVNIRYTLPVIRAAIKHNVGRAICVHTTGVYSKFKAASEEYLAIETELSSLLESADINVTILRPTMIYGDMCDRNMSKFIRMVDRLRVFPVIDHGRCLIQPVNARDLGKAYYQVLTTLPMKLKYSYNLSGEKPVAMVDVLRVISSALDKRTFFFSVPSWVGVTLARLLRACTLGKVDYVEKVQRMTEDRCFSHDEARRDFGYNPEPFTLGIEREVEEYKSLIGTSNP